MIDLMGRLLLEAAARREFDEVWVLKEQTGWVGTTSTRWS